MSDTPEQRSTARDPDTGADGSTRRLDRRRFVRAAGAATAVAALGPRLARGAAAQDATPSRAYAGTTLNLLMEDILETTIIEEMLPDFEALTGIKVQFEKVEYGIMHEKLVPQLAAGAGNGAYDVLEVDFYWVYEYARSGWVEELSDRIAKSQGAIDLGRYVPATLDINSKADGKTYYVPFYPYPMGLIYRKDLLDDPGFKDAYKAKTGKDLALPTSVADYVEMAKAVKGLKGDIYGAAMQAQQVDPIVMEFCNFLYGVGGDYYDAAMKQPAINNATGVKAAELYADCVQHAAQPGAAGANLNDTMAVYSQGKAFSMISYLFMLTEFNNPDKSTVVGKNALAVMPGGKGLTGAWSWGLPKSSPHPDAGWEFIKWVESPGVALKRAMKGGVPSQAAPYANAEFVAKYPWMPQAKELIAAGKGLPAVTKQAQLVEIMGRHLSDVVSGSKTAPAAMDAAAKELTELL